MMRVYDDSFTTPTVRFSVGVEHAEPTMRRIDGRETGVSAKL